MKGRGRVDLYMVVQGRGVEILWIGTPIGRLAPTPRYWRLTQVLIACLGVKIKYI